MPGGVVFLVCIPTLNYEHELVFGVPIPQKRTRRAENKLQRPVANVDLRLKEVKSKAELLTLDDEQEDIDVTGQYRTGQLNAPGPRQKPNDPVFISMETVCKTEYFIKQLPLRKKRNLHFFTAGFGRTFEEIKSATCRLVQGQRKHVL